MPAPQRRALRPDDPAVMAAFVLGASAAAVAAGRSAHSLADADVVASPTGQRLLQVWFGAAILGALLLPAGVLAGWAPDPVVRRALLPYLILLLVQVGTEGTVPRVLPRWTVLVTGSLYTGFRLWQLSTAVTDLRAAAPTRGRRAALRTVVAGRAFWAGNLGVLAASAATLRPSIGPSGAV